MKYENYKLLNIINNGHQTDNSPGYENHTVRPNTVSLYADVARKQVIL